MSVLSPGVEPGEPLAKVLTLHPTETKPALSSTTPPDVRYVDPARRAAQQAAAARGSIIRWDTGYITAIR